MQQPQSISRTSRRVTFSDETEEIGPQGQSVFLPATSNIADDAKHASGISEIPQSYPITASQVTVHVSATDSPVDLPVLTAQQADKDKKISCLKSLKKQAKRLKREVTAIYYAVHDPRTSMVAKILPALILTYALSPIDLIPDFIPVLGLLDDLILLPLLILLAIKLIPTEVMSDARQRSATDPLHLGKNWCFAVIIFLLWLGSVEYLVFYISMHCRVWWLVTYKVHILAGIAVAMLFGFALFMWKVILKERRKRDEMQQRLLG